MRNLLNRKLGSIAYNLSLSTSHCPDVTVEKDVKLQVLHPFIHECIVSLTELLVKDLRSPVIRYRIKWVDIF